MISETNTIRFQYLAPNAVRVSHDGLFLDPIWLKDVLLPLRRPFLEKPAIQVEIIDQRIRFRNESQQILVEEIGPVRNDIRKIHMSLDVDIPKTLIHFEHRKLLNAVRLKLAIQPGEKFYGWGEWFNAFSRSSGTIQLKIRDAISLIQDHETYSGIPIFFSNRGYAFWLLNSHPSRWKIDARKHLLQIEADRPGTDYILIYGPDFQTITQTLTALTGRPPLLPRWAFGLMVTTYPQNHQESVLEHAREHRNRNIPLDSVILDYHWEEKFHNFQWRKALIPDSDQLIRELKKLGVKLGLIITPFENAHNRKFQKFFLNYLAHNIPPGLENDDERPLHEYQEGIERGYFAHPLARWWFGQGGMLDFINPAAVDWWFTLMKPLYDQGIAFFKNDDGEYLPLDAKASNGMTGLEYHNIYGFYYNRALFDNMARLDQRRPMIYARSAWVGSQRYPALFLGDQKPTYDGIRRTMRAALNLSLLGFSYWTADIFGLDGKTTPELHMRHSQWALFAPIARYFYRPPDIDNTRLPWSYGKAEEENFRKYVQLRYRLLPYYSQLGWQAYLSGIPIVRPLVMEFPGCQELEAIDDQMMLGNSLMIAPVLEKGAIQRKIVLPAGIWHDFWSVQSWEGPAIINYDAPPDRLPILVKGGTILPMGPVLQFIPEDHTFDQLQFHIWPPYSAHLTFFEDDGRTRGYMEGQFNNTEITVFQKEHASIEISINSDLQWDNPVTTRNFGIILHKVSRPNKLIVNGTASQQFFYDGNIQQLEIPVHNSPAGQIQVIL